jgi:activator of 2-hydroxyglutaryl-CoA dehydratase
LSFSQRKQNAALHVRHPAFKKTGMSFSLGIDYGSNSVRALVVDTRNGRELGTCVMNYPSGNQGILLDARDHNVARQQPLTKNPVL